MTPGPHPPPRRPSPACDRRPRAGALGGARTAQPERRGRSRSHPLGRIRHLVDGRTTERVTTKENEMNTALKRLLVWSPAIALILSAAAVPGGIALFFAPLLGLG